MKIHYISPYRSDKNIGKAINDAIIQLQAAEDDFIVHTDHDCMFLLPDSKRQLEEILESTDFDILGPLTNRLAGFSQTIAGAFDITDLRDHIKMAQQLSEIKYGKTTEVREQLAAFCLCFRRRTWTELGGFPENNIQFDYLFCSRALRDGKRLGVMIGIYMFHLYRLWSEGDARREISHLV